MFCHIGIDTLYAGIATHFCRSEKIHALEQALIDLENADDVECILNDFCTPMIDGGEFSLAKYLEQIDTCFSASTIEAILLNLENDGSDWAKQTIKVSFNVEFEIWMFFRLLILVLKFTIDNENGITDLFEIDIA